MKANSKKAARKPVKNTKKEKRVLAIGTFDLLHPGHLHYLNQAKKNGHLIVLVARDLNVERIKQRKPIFDEKHRLELVKSLKMVDEAVLGNLENMYAKIKEINPDILAMGYDQEPSNSDLKIILANLKISPKIIRIKELNPKEFKSHTIRQRIKTPEPTYMLDY